MPPPGEDVPAFARPSPLPVATEGDPLALRPRPSVLSGLARAGDNPVPVLPELRPVELVPPGRRPEVPVPPSLSPSKLDLPKVFLPTLVPVKAVSPAGSQAVSPAGSHSVSPVGGILLPRLCVVALGEGFLPPREGFLLVVVLRGGERPPGLLAYRSWYRRGRFYRPGLFASYGRCRLCPPGLLAH